jgi:hypothetical protein
MKPERRRVGLLVLAVAFLGLAGCSQGNVFSLKVGDCFMHPPVGELTDVEIVNCSNAHEQEVFATFDLSGSTWPGRDQVEELAEQGCLGRFRSYVGIDYEYSEYYGSDISPTEDSWNRGDDREVVCSLGPQYGTKTGSARGTRR